VVNAIGDDWSAARLVVLAEVGDRDEDKLGFRAGFGVDGTRT